jgi:8-oxo-dGTP diphosphatase
VLWRYAGESGSAEPSEAPAGVELALVHRPSYDDWSLPKGKLRTGEHPLVAAVREVEEETGAIAVVAERLKPVEYLAGGMPKRVHYWSMRYLRGSHRPDNEVDQIRWVPLDAADEVLSYDVDRTVLAQFATLSKSTGRLLLVRHAKAGKRSQWAGDDRDRPLDRIGRRQARDLVPILRAFAPHRILAADRVRCERTVYPLATSVALPVETVPALSDEEFDADPKRAMDLVDDLAKSGSTVVVCSQGDAIPGILEALEVRPGPPYVCRKSSTWALTLNCSTVVAADYYPRPGT